MKKYLLVMFLIFTSCEIEEVLRQPLLASPLGLEVKTAPLADGSGTGLVLYFTANNPEIYFSGFSIYVSDDPDCLTATKDTYWFDIEESDATLLPNDNPISDDCKMSIYVGGEMAFPERRTYPESVGWNTDTSTSSSPEFTWTTFSEYTNTITNETTGDITYDITVFDDITSETTFYFAVYSYSSIDDEYSLPSNVASITFP